MKLPLASAFLALSVSAFAEPLVKPDDTVALAGGANIERTRFYPWLQTQLVAAFPDGTLKVRNFGWEGDTVFEQWRDGGDVEKLDAKRRAAEKRNQETTGTTSWRQQRDWNQQLTDAGATLVLAQFGQMESLAGDKGLPAFIAAYETLIAEFAKGGRRVILLEPVPFEKSDLPHGPDLPALNTTLAAYTTAIRELATKLKLPIVPLTVVGENRPALTENGFHLSEAGHRFVAKRVMEGLGLTAAPDDSLAAAHREMGEFERLWFDYWRPMNWAFLTGDRTNVPYSRDWRTTTNASSPRICWSSSPSSTRPRPTSAPPSPGKRFSPFPSDPPFPSSRPPRNPSRPRSRSPPSRPWMALP